MQYLAPFLVLVFAGCQTPQPYQPAALPTADSAIATALAARPEPGTGELSLNAAAALLATHNSELATLRAEFATLARVAEFANPLPNPSLEAGGSFGTKLEDDRRPLGPHFGLVFALPMGPRLARGDDLDAAKAAAADLEIRARHRELYLELRAAYAEIALARRRMAEQAAVAAMAAESAELAQKLTEIGSATRLDVGLMELDFEEQRLAFAHAESAVAEAEGALAKLLGVDYRILRGRPLQELKFAGEWPDIEALRKLLVAHHPDLARLRGDFAVADAHLRAELAEQIPDLEFGTEFEQDVGEEKQVLGLSVGVELPLFDRNAQGIAEATGQRDAVRVRYEATLAAALAELDSQRERFGMHSHTRSLLEKNLLPRAKSALADGERMLQAGVVNTQRLFELRRRQRQLKLQLVDAEIARIRALLAIESSIGRPLFLLPDESLPKVNL
ncbi:MAG: outer membrane protein TolC [Rhodothermales bacterium]|jgi:outer membrane protein TolC